MNNQLKFTIDRNAVQILWDCNSHRPIGTAFFFLRPDWLVTAKHVVVEKGLCRDSLAIVPYDHSVINAKIAFIHPEIDIAVIKLDQFARCKTPLFPSYHKFTGSKGLVSCGYSPSLADSKEKRPSIFINKIESFEIEQRNRNLSDEEIILFEAPYSEGGFSGGPIIGEGGGVVGLIIENFSNGTKKFARATSILSLLKGLCFSSNWNSK